MGETEDSDKKITDETKAITEKNLGNAFYRKREFAEALKCYDKAITLVGTNITFYSNKAAVYFEQGKHELCRETCLTAISVGRKYNAEKSFIAKAFARIGNSYFKEKLFEEAMEFFTNSLKESDSREIRGKILICEKEIIELKKLSYVNPRLSIEEENKGDEAFESGEETKAVQHYTEAIMRNPNDNKLYLKRAKVYVKMKNYKSALVDCDAAIKLKSNSDESYVLKGSVLELVDDHDSAIEVYQKALEIEPKNKEARKGNYRCLTEDYQQRNAPKNIQERALTDPEIGKIMTDTKIVKILEEVRENPKNWKNHLNDIEIVEKLKTLYRVGLIDIDGE